MGAIFGIFETCPKCSLGSPKKVQVVSAETHVSFEIGSDFKNVAENQFNPCNLGAIFGIFEFCPKRSLGTPEKL